MSKEVGEEMKQLKEDTFDDFEFKKEYDLGIR